ncbi:primase-helicase family protein [Lysobacter sp. M15]|uniref:primase-helicase family protein n=1 Tax=Lysobacter sp. M15 TaxID=2916837 RepID=UPI001F58AE57|nr:primase-helicase family protein [Lysobacter sp. M15]
MTNTLTTVTHVPRISEETQSRVRELQDRIAACGDDMEMHNEVIPAIQQAGIPGAYHERIVSAVDRRLEFLDGKIPIAKLRALIFPPALPRTDDGLPEWAQPYCFVTSQDEFFNTNNGECISLRGFDVAYGRMMPFSASNRRLSAAEHCTQIWNMPIVERVGYRPDCGPLYEWDGVRYANRYSPSSLPPVAPLYSPRGWGGIMAFQQHLYDMCGRRDAVFQNLLYWFAHNVQRPGVKTRWAPLLKGVQGDGKTLSTTVLRAAMGYRNLSTTSNSNIANSGGFTDWAVRGAVNVIEEIMLTGKARYQLYNGMKEFISNNIVDINPKGAKPYQAYNCTNHIALTNHNDAIPLESTDRRWFIIFTPWADLAGMMRYCGLDAAGWKARADAIDYAKEHCAGELRKWLLGVEIPEWFDISGSAMLTPERQRMMASSEDDAESTAKDIIRSGAVGITENVLSSSHLAALLEFRAHAGSFTVPKTIALSHMLTRIGYSKVERQVNWEGTMRTIWLKNGVELTNDQIRLELDNSKLNFKPSK